jgi:hypothetical protein
MAVFVLDEVGMPFDLENDLLWLGVIFGPWDLMLGSEPNVGQKITTCPYGLFEAVLENSLVVDYVCSQTQTWVIEK